MTKPLIKIDRMRSQYGSLHAEGTVVDGVEITAQFAAEDIDNKSTLSIDDIKSKAQKKNSWVPKLAIQSNSNQRALCRRLQIDACTWS